MQDEYSGELQTPFLTILVATLGMAAATLVQSVLVVTSVELTHRFNIGTFHFGALFASFSLSGAVLARTSGKLIDSRPLKLTLIIFLCWAAVSIGLLSWSPNIFLVWGAVIIGGAANAAGNIGTTKAVALGVRKEWQGLGLGIKQAGAYLSVMIAGLVPLLQPYMGWRYATLVVLCVPLVGIPFVSRLSGQTALNQIPSAGNLEDPGLGRLSGIAFLLACGISTILSFGALFLVHASTLSARAAGLAVAVMGGMAAVSRVYWGWSADRDLAKALGRITALSASAMCILIIGDYVSSTALLLLGIFMAGFSFLAWHSAGWLAVITISGSADAGNAAGKVLRATLLAFCIAPPLFGWLVNLLEGYMVPWLLVLIITLAAHIRTRGLLRSMPRV